MKDGFFQHPSALVESTTIGAGTRIWAFAHILRGVRIGRDCNIGDHCFLEGGVRLGNNVTVKNGVCLWEGVTLKDNVFVGPNAVFTNDLLPRSPRFELVTRKYQSKKWLSPTLVGEGAAIGANATVLCGVRIGQFAMVGAGAVVTRDVPTHALVVGVPGELRGYVCRCGQILRFKQQRSLCRSCRSQYKLIRGAVRYVK